jgi:hypothetical protein
MQLCIQLWHFLYLTLCCWFRFIPLSTVTLTTNTVIIAIVDCSGNAVTAFMVWENVNCKCWYATNSTIIEAFDNECTLINFITVLLATARWLGGYAVTSQQGVSVTQTCTFDKLRIQNFLYLNICFLHIAWNVCIPVLSDPFLMLCFFSFQVSQ